MRETRNFAFPFRRDGVRLAEALGSLHTVKPATHGAGAVDRGEVAAYPALGFGSDAVPTVDHAWICPEAKSTVPVPHGTSVFTHV